jgi:acetyltransferase
MAEVAAQELLGAQGIPVVRTGLERLSSEAVRLSKPVGLPVALKIVPQDVIHKCEVDGVQLQLTCLGQVSEAYRETFATERTPVPAAIIEGVSVPTQGQNEDRGDGRARP